MSKKNILLVTILVLAMIVLGVVIWNFWGRVPVEPLEKTAVTFTEKSVTCDSFQATGMIVEVWNTYLPEVSATRELTPVCMIDSLRDISQGKYDFRWCGSNVAYYCYEGVKIKEVEGEPMELLRTMGSFWGHTVHIITKADSPINDISDLKDKAIKVATVKERQLPMTTKEILGTYGIPSNKVEIIKVLSDEIVETLKAGDADIAIVSFPTGSREIDILKLKEETELKFLALSEDIIEKLKKKFPYYTDGLIPANTYPNQPSDVKGIATRATVVCRENMNPDLVYKLTKAIFDHIDEIKAVSPMVKEMSLERALEGLAIPLHPGAERYYSEKGILK